MSLPVSPSYTMSPSYTDKEAPQFYHSKFPKNIKAWHIIWIDWRLQECGTSDEVDEVVYLAYNAFDRFYTIGSANAQG